MSVDAALESLAVADQAAAAAERAAEALQQVRRDRVTAAFNAGATGAAVAAVLAISPQRAYQLRGRREHQTTE